MKKHQEDHTQPNPFRMWKYIAIMGLLAAALILHGLLCKFGAINFNGVL